MQCSAEKVRGLQRLFHYTSLSRNKKSRPVDKSSEASEISAGQNELDNNEPRDLCFALRSPAKRDEGWGDKFFVLFNSKKKGAVPV